MFESMSQPNPEKDAPKQFLIPEGDQFVYGFVTGAREERTTSPQRNGPPLQLRKVEVQYEIAGPDGEVTIKKKMITDYLLTDSVQEEMMQDYQQNLKRQQGE